MQIPNIDTLIATIDLFDYDSEAKKLIEHLEFNKQKAKLIADKDGYEKVIITIGNMSFEVLPNGARHHAYILHNDHYELKFARFRSKSNDTYPVFIKIKSACLWEKGYKEAWQNIIAFISDNIGQVQTNKVSRVDLCCHTDELNLIESDINKFSGKFRSDEIYRDDRQLSGFTFGSGKNKRVFCTIYNKTLEVKKKRQKLWFFNIWDKHGMDKDNVWNVEYQLGRKYFKEYKLETVEDVFSHISSIWRYCTTDWMQFKILDNNRKDRCTTNEAWSNVQASFNEIVSKELVKSDERLKADAEVLIPSIIGYITSYSARRKTGITEFDLGETIIDLTSRGLEYLEHNKDSNFGEEVQKKLALLG